ncbi:glycosyltransferase family 4 protein [Leifsonia sp. McL0607]|uniref:glycosyltransferase family 4 protein n=1 Tax=Leifsonia sp. McL0607 TaxID=3415672 RepID=UPI003CF5D4F2
MTTVIPHSASLVAPGRFGRSRGGYALRWRALWGVLETTGPSVAYLALDDYGVRTNSVRDAMEHPTQANAAAAVVNVCRHTSGPVVFTELRSAPYLLAARRALRDSHLLLDLHNVESHLKQQLAAIRTPGYTDAYVEAVRHFEARACLAASEVWVCSDDDAQLLRTVLGVQAPNIRVVPNAVDVPPRIQTTGQVTSATFVGSLAYAPNVEAVRFLIDELAPALQRRHVDLPLRAAGSEPSVELASELMETGFEVHANFDSLASVLRDSALLVPLFTGSGTRFKILEAMSMGVPIVTTPKGAEGIDVKDGVHVLVAANAHQFVEALDLLRTDRALVWDLTAAAYELVSDRYSFESIANALPTRTRNTSASVS